MNDSVEGYVEWKGWEEDEFGKFDRWITRYYAWHVHQALGARTKPLQVLELGFGNGTFLGYCRAQGWTAAGVELEERLRARAERAGFAVAPTVQALPESRRYDLIALFDVLEHIPAADVVTFVRSLTALLPADGAILLRVPNGDSPFGRRHQHGDLTHVTSFGEFKLKQLAQLAGLKLVTLGEAPWHSQQAESRNLRCLCRAMARWVVNRVVGFAYFNRAVDLSANVVAVMVPAGSPREAMP